MSLAASLVCAVLLAPARPAQLSTANDQRVRASVDVRLVGTADAPRLWIRAERAPVRAVMQAVAHELQRDLVGFDAIHRYPTISARIEDRPAKDAVRWVLGSVGLRAVVDEDQIFVVEDLSAFPTRDELLKRANARYLRASIDYPDYPHSDRAVFARGRVNEELGGPFRADAVYAYDALVDDHPRSEHVPEALLRGARLAAAMGDPAGAAGRYEQLAELATRHPWHATARLELALALCRLAEGAESAVARHASAQKAVFVLDALDDGYRAETNVEHRERLLVRARALALTDEPITALKALDLAARYSERGQSDPRVLELRAIALGYAGRYGDASTAWLAYAREVEGDEHVRAFVRAADEALRGGHELAAIAIEAKARAEGFGDAVAPAAGEARARLGLDDGLDASSDPAAGLARGERFLRERRHELAVQALRPVFGRRTRLERDAALRLALAYAQALDGAGLPIDAIDVLRTAAGELSRREDRREIYLLASRLYEKRGQYERAVDAVQGKL